MEKQTTGYKTNADMFRRIYPDLPQTNPNRFYRNFSNTKDGIKKQIQYLKYFGKKCRFDTCFPEEIRKMNLCIVKAELRLRWRVIRYLNQCNIDQMDLKKKFKIDLGHFSSEGEDATEILKYANRKFAKSDSYLKYLYLDLWVGHLKAYSEDCDIYREAYYSLAAETSVQGEKERDKKKIWHGYKYELGIEIISKHKYWTKTKCFQYAAEHFKDRNGKNFTWKSIKDVYYRTLERSRP